MTNFGAKLTILTALLAFQVTGKQIQKEDVDLSCSSEKQQAMLAKCQSPLDDVTKVVTKFPDGKRRCGYKVLNIFPDPSIFVDESLVALEDKKKHLPPCSKCETEVFLLNSLGNVIQGPEIERETTEPGAPQAVTEIHVKAEDETISVAWNYPLPDCPRIRFNISYEHFDLNNFARPKIAQAFVVNGLSHGLSNVQHNSLYEICITTVIEEEKGPKTCTNIQTKKKTLPAPTNLELTNSTSSSVTVAWEPPEGVEVVSYKLTVVEAQSPEDIERTEDKLEETEAQVSTPTAITYTLPAKLYSHTIENLKSGYKYRIGVKAVDASGSEGYETDIFVSMDPADSEKPGKEVKSTASSPPESKAETDGSQAGREDIDLDKTNWVIIALSIVVSLFGILAFILTFVLCCICCDEERGNISDMGIFCREERKKLIGKNVPVMVV